MKESAEQGILCEIEGLRDVILRLVLGVHIHTVSCSIYQSNVKNFDFAILSHAQNTHLDTRPTRGISS